jgi:hypothetical protein
MKTIIVAGNDSDEEELNILVAPPASNGYYTNIRITVLIDTVVIVQDVIDPVGVYFGTHKDPRTPIVEYTDLESQIVSTKNAVQFVVNAHDFKELENSSVKCFRMFTKKRVYVNDGQHCSLNYVLPYATGPVTIILQADFVPYPGSRYVQYDRAEDMEGGSMVFSEPIGMDLSPALITVNYYIEDENASVGELIIRRMRGEAFDVSWGNTVADRTGATFDEDIGSEDFVASSAILATIPLSSTNTNMAGTFKLPVKNLEAGDFILLDYSSRLGVGAPTQLQVDLMIEGTVAYSKKEEFLRAHFIEGSHYKDISEVSIIE